MRMRQRRLAGSAVGRLAAIAGAVSLLLTGCSGAGAGGADDTYTITLAVPATEEGMMNGTNWWAEEITKRTDGRVQFDIHYSGSLLPALEVLPGIKDGRVTGGWLSDPYWPAEFPLWQVVGIPFETDDAYAGAMAFYELYQEHDAFREEFHRAGVHPLHFLPYFPTMMGANEPVGGLDDLKGKRLRTVGYLAHALEAVGAEPAAVDATEMYESIQRGVLDGYAGFPLDTVTEFSLQEVAPHTVDMGVGHYASTAIGVSLDFWESLPEDLRTTITDVSRELQEERATAELMKLTEPVCARYAEAKADVSSFDKSDVDRWQDKVGDSVVRAWQSDAIKRGVSKDVAVDFHAAYLDTYERHLEDSPYKNPVEQCAGQAAPR